MGLVELLLRLSDLLSALPALPSALGLPWGRWCAEAMHPPTHPRCHPTQLRGGSKAGRSCSAPKRLV